MGHHPLEPVTKKIKNNNLPEWSSLQASKRWVGGREQTKRKKAAKLFKANQEGKPLWRQQKNSQ